MLHARKSGMYTTSLAHRLLPGDDNRFVGPVILPYDLIQASTGTDDLDSNGRAAQSRRTLQFVRRTRTISVFRKVKHRQKQTKTRNARSTGQKGVPCCRYTVWNKDTIGVASENTKKKPNIVCGTPCSHRKQSRRCEHQVIIQGKRLKICACRVSYQTTSAKLFSAECRRTIVRPHSKTYIYFSLS